MGETRDRLIERLKVPKIWDKEHRLCPRKRCILAVLAHDRRTHLPKGLNLKPRPY
jgi:hypothetical protein